MRKIVALVMAALLMVASFAGCAATKKTVKVGIAAPNATHGWVAGVTYYAEKYLKESNIEYKVTTSADAAEMEENLDSLKQWGANVVIAYPQWTGMEPAISKLIDSKITVVAFDVEIDCDGIYKVTGDNYGMGYESAKYIVEKVGAGATISVLDVPSSGSVTQLRKQGFYDYLKEINYDTSNIFETSETTFSREEGLKDMTEILKKHDHVDAVFSMDDETSIGVVRAIKVAGRTDIKAITGGGGMQEYFGMIADAKNSDLGLASALYSPNMVEKAIQTGIAVFNGEKSESVLVVPTTIVTPNNVTNFIDPNNTIY